MSDNWTFFPCSIDEHSAFIFVDVGIKTTIDDSAPKALAKISLTYKFPRENGLPTSDEFEAVVKIEQSLEQHSLKQGDWYVGRTTFAGQRHFYVYTTYNEVAWKKTVDNLSHDSGYEMALSYRQDPMHACYHEELYPTEDDWQVIKDMRVMDALKKEGDDGTEPRKIDHWVYFENKQAAADFVIWAENDRFKEDAEWSHSTDEGKYCVRLHHDGPVTLHEITSHTIALRRKAAEFGGDYDGWETPVVKKTS